LNSDFFILIISLSISYSKIPFGLSTEFVEIILKIIRLEYLRRLSDWNPYSSKIDHVIRENENKNNDLSLIKLNS
jgi:hypothetical protein